VLLTLILEGNKTDFIGSLSEWSPDKHEWSPY